MIQIFRRATSDEEIKKLEKLETGAWVNLVNPTPDEISHWSKELDVEEDVLRIALDDDEKPRIEIEDKYRIIVVRVPYIEDNTVNVVPVAIIVANKFIITVALREVDVLSGIYKKTLKNFYTTKKTRFVMQILSRTNNHFQKVLNEIEKKIEHKEKTLLKSSRNEEIVQLLDVQKSLVYINTAVVSNDKVLERILNGKVLKLFDEDEDLLESIIIENKESIEMVNIYSNILANTMDAYASIISNNLNMVMKFLASVTIISAIPTIIASFWGMNVALPFATNAWAFPIILGITVMLSSVATMFFVKKGYF